MFTFGCDIPVCVLAWLWLLSWRVRFVSAWWLSVLCGWVPGTLAVIAVLVMGAVAWCRLVRWSGRSGGEAGEGPAAPAAAARRSLCYG